MIDSGNLKELEDTGFTVLKSLVPKNYLCEFERQIADLVSAQLSELGLQAKHPDPFVDLFTVGGPYQARFYKLLERLHILNRIGVHIGDGLEAAGFFERLGMNVPLVWPDIRADIPNDTELQLPIHQDYKSTQCHKAYRLWVPLRPSNEEYGTLCAYPGTHKQGPVEHDLRDPLKPTIDPRLHRGMDKVVFDIPAGDGVLIDPHLFHGSVANRSSRTKFTLLLQVQDLATMIDPDDEKYGEFSRATLEREAKELSMDQARPD